MWEYYYPDELYHHGTKGMKWGVRRYQNKDGSLTAAGKKRRTLGQAIHDHKVNKKRKAALEKAREAKAAKKVAEEKAKVAAEKRQKALEKGRIPLKKMTDAELKAYKTRLQSEKDVKDLVMETRPMKRLMSKMWSDAVVPSITEGGKDLLKTAIKKYGSDALGLTEKDLDKAAKAEYERVKREAEIAKFKKQKFDNERDLAESKKNYQAFLDDEDAQSAARQKYKNDKAGIKNENNNNGGKKNKKASKQDTKAKADAGEDYVKNSSEALSKHTVAESSPNIKRVESWIEKASTGEVLRNMTVDYEED